MRAKEAVGPLIVRARKDGPDIGIEVFRVIGSLGTTQARNFSYPLLKSKNDRLSKAAWACFALCPENGDIDMVFKIMGEGKGAALTGATTALGKLALRPDLQEMLSSRFRPNLLQDHPLRMRYAQALAALPPEPFESILIELSTDQDPRIRILGIRGLSQEYSTARYIFGVFPFFYPVCDL